MSSIAFEIERSFIDQELGSLYSYCSYTVRQCVNVFPEGHFHIIEICLQRLPQMHILNFQNALSSLTLSYQISFFIKNFYFAVSSSHSIYLVRNSGSSSAYLRNQSNIFNVVLWCRIDFYWSCNSTIVEEIEVGIILGFCRAGRTEASHSVHHIGFPADRKGCVVDHIVNGNGQKVVSILKLLCNLHFKGKEAALMLADQFSV